MDEYCESCVYAPQGLVDDISKQRVLRWEDPRGEHTVRLTYPILDPATVRAIQDRLRSAREEYLVAMTTQRIAGDCARAARLWCDPAFELRRKAEALLPVITGFSSEMVTGTLDSMMLGLTEESLMGMVCGELGCAEALDRFVYREGTAYCSMAMGPGLVTEVFSGNVPGLPVLSIICGLLTKSAVFGKCATGEPLFPALFARTLREIGSPLAHALAILYWEGGNKEIEHAAFSGAGAIIVYGGPEAIAGIRRGIPAETRFVPYGHKISFGVVSAARLTPATLSTVAKAAARDTAVFDQQGCLSPHAVFVQNGAEVPPKAFAEALGVELESLAHELPRGTLSQHEAIDMQNTRARALFSAINGDSVTLFASEGNLQWTVICDESGVFTPSCLNRVVRVIPFNTFEDLLTLVAPLRGFLQTVGCAVSRAESLELGLALGAMGATRFVPLGTMTDVTTDWHHDGRYNILDLVYWVDIVEECEANMSRGGENGDAFSRASAYEGRCTR